MKILSKFDMPKKLMASDVTINIHTDQKTPECLPHTTNTMRGDIPQDIIRGLKVFEIYVVNRGYVDFQYEFVKNPRMTERGFLYVKGSFVGPSPYEDAQKRDPNDFYAFDFIIFEYRDTFYIEIYFSTALISVIEITPHGINILKELSGNLPSV